MQPDGCAARAPKGERREATQAMSTAERRAKAHLRYQRFLPTKDRGTLKPLSSKQGQKQIAETQNTNHCRTKNEPRARPDGQYLMKFNNCKLQPGISFPRAKLREMRAENLNAVFPHMGGKPQKYRTAPLC